MSTSQSSRPTSRRTLVAAAGAAGLTAALSACGDSGGGSDTVDSGSGAEDSGGEDSGGDGGAEGVLAKITDIPEGGGKVFADQQVVVTQPAKGDFKAFTSECTHQGCAVSSISGGTINCPCHGSKFSIEDGSVKHPPATQPLASKKIEVSGDSIKLV